MNQALELFFSILPEYKDIKYSIKAIHTGFTNKSYCIDFGFKKFQIRMGMNNDIVDRRNENNVIKTLNLDVIKYYDVEKGNMIKEWIEGKQPKVNTDVLIQLIKGIKELHSIVPTLEILRHDYYCFIQNSKEHIPDECLELYDWCVKECVDENNFVLSHNDLNLHNMVYTKDKRLVFIDYEWARMNDEYWDIANFCREANLRIKRIIQVCEIYQTIKLEKLIKFIYISLCFAVQWTYYTEPSKYVLKYRKQVYKRMINYFKIIKRGQYDK